MSETTTKVKAWTFTTTSYPSTLQLTDTETPSTPPTPTSIIIRPRAVSLNPVDIQLMNLPFNNLPPYTPIFGSFSGTKIAGRDFSGIVLAAGPASPYKPDDEIMGINMGVPGTGFLSRAVCLDTSPKSGATLTKKPAHLTHVQAASLPCVYMTARTSIEKCRPYMTRLSQTTAPKIAILGGSSSTGIYSVKLAKRENWTVLSTCSTRNVDFVRSLGADTVTDYTTSPTAVVDAVRAFQPDAIVDCVGGTETVGLAPKYVTIVGDKTSRSTMGGSALYLTHPMMVLRWLAGYLGLGPSYECIVLESNPKFLEEVDGLKGEDVVIDSVYGFERVKEAFERLDTGRCRGKVVVNLDE